MPRSFVYSRQGLRGRQRRLERLLEVLPGLSSWCVLVGMVVLTVLKPFIAAAVVIAFYLYWLARIFYFTFFLVLSYVRLESERSTDWMQRLHGLQDLRAYREQLARQRPQGWRQRLSLWVHRRELRVLDQPAAALPALSALVHVVVIPIARETAAIYEPGLERLRRQSFPVRQILVVLAVEGWAAPAIHQEAQAVQARYRSHFYDVWVSIHPAGLPGEARVKGANATWAAKQVEAYLEQRGVADECVIISCFDADTLVDDTYFACLTYAFMVCPERARASFQPIPVYHNNIWQVPSFARLLDLGASFFQLIEATNPEKLVSFSSHSMSFKALKEIGYWPGDIISDDSAVFWKALIHYQGDYRVVPMYVTVSMDVAAGRSFWSTAVNVYKQKRRWAWGVENFPLVVRGFCQAPRMHPWDKVRHVFKLWEGHVAWATWPFLLTVIGWLPAAFAGAQFENSVMYYTTPRIAGLIFNLSTAALLVMIVLSLSMLPRPHGRFALLRQLLHIGEWFLIPVTALVFSAVPALDAQTRLMLGRYMEFWITEKRRASE